jgi:hypothetical protein
MEYLVADWIIAGVFIAGMWTQEPTRKVLTALVDLATGKKENS